MTLEKLVLLAQESSFYRFWLNVLLGRMIPFNKPHGFKVLAISKHEIKVLLPFRRSNFNHIRGIHACALATVSEFATGLLLVTRLDARKYRLIMQRLEMDYHYQGKMDAIATFSISEEWLNTKIFGPLQESDAVVVSCEIAINDVKGNHLTTGKVYWQVKDWQKVKTKVAA
jgi:acyl-coenzyme A thioesterase PaaI-like protein